MSPERDARAQDPGVPPRPTPTPGSADAPLGLPDDVLAARRPTRRHPGRRDPRRGDLVLTILLSVVLYAIAIDYVREALARGSVYAHHLDGTQLATVLAVIAPIVLAVFSTVFSILFLLRRIWAFWLPVFAAGLIVALYSITQGMLDQAVLSKLLPGS